MPRRLRHGNPTFIAPRSWRNGTLALCDAATGDLIWSSHLLTGANDSVRVDVWHGRFVGPAAGWAVLAAGAYRAIWRESDGRERAAVQVQLNGWPVAVMERGTHRGRTGRWIGIGQWCWNKVGLAAERGRVWYFAEAASHGHIRATFQPAASAASTAFGLIARHYNGFHHMQLAVTRGNEHWQAVLRRMVGTPGDPEAHVDLVQGALVQDLLAPITLAWDFNGSQHRIQLGDGPQQTALDDWMGGVEVVGFFADAGAGAWQGFEMHSTQPIPRHRIDRPQYIAEIRPGNISALQLRSGEVLTPNICWESGIQFGHIGGSEIKFTQGATQHGLEQGPVCDRVGWRGPMPKLVEQADDVRGMARGDAWFYPDRIVIDDRVLSWTRRSVGPDLDMLGPLLARPARVALPGGSFVDWSLSTDGGLAVPASPTENSAFPVAMVLPLAHPSLPWYLLALIDLRRPARETVPSSLFAWQCVHQTTASHDFRVAPSEVGIEYAFSIMLAWQCGGSVSDAELAAVNLRDDWLHPARMTVHHGHHCDPAPHDAHPDAADLDGDFDRAAGRYVIHAQWQMGPVGAQATLDPGRIPRRSVVVEIRGWPTDTAPHVTLDDTSVSPCQVLTQHAPGQRLYLWFPGPLTSPLRFGVAPASRAATAR